MDYLLEVGSDGSTKTEAPPIYGRSATTLPDKAMATTDGRT